VSDRDALIAALSPDTVIAPEHMAEALYLARQEAIRLTGDRDRLASLLERARQAMEGYSCPRCGWVPDDSRDRQHQGCDECEEAAAFIAALPAPEEGWICKGEPDGRPDHDPIQVHPLRRCPSCGEPPAAAPAPEGVPEDRTPFAVPDRIAIDANGYGWRVFGHGTDDETWSMVPVNPDNTAPPQPMSWYVPAPAEPREVIDQAGIDHILAALIEVGPWEDMDDLDGEGTEASIIADHIRDLGRRLAPEGWKVELPHHALTRPRLVPEDFPIEDRPRVCNHGIYHHGCPSCDRQDPEDR